MLLLTPNEQSQSTTRETNKLTVSAFVETDFRGIILLSTLSVEGSSLVTHIIS